MRYLKNIKPYDVINMLDFVTHKGNQISSKAITDNDAVEIRFFSAAKGEEIDKEEYPQETIFICLEGKIQINYKDNDEVILKQGEMLSLESGIDYGLKVLEPSKFYNILIKTD